MLKLVERSGDTLAVVVFVSLVGSGERLSESVLVGQRVRVVTDQLSPVSLAVPAESVREAESDCVLRLVMLGDAVTVELHV
jgi:hypothetical protein